MSKGFSFIEPQLPTFVDKPPEGDRGIHEIKYDGYRSQIVINRGNATIYTRRGHDWTKRSRFVADQAAKLPVQTAILDGEMVATDKDGKTNIRAFRDALEWHPRICASGL